MAIRNTQFGLRISAIATALSAIVAGVAVRRLLPWGFWHKYLGVALWSVVLYALLVAAWPRIRVATAALLALGVSWAVEFAQITPLPGWLSAQHPLLRFVFGEHFSMFDLPAYAVGVAAAALLHAAARRG